jgi:AraC-like DNA-binding protein
MARSSNKPSRGVVPKSLESALESIGARIPEIVALFDHIEDLQFWIKGRSGTFIWVNVPFLLNYGLKHRSQVIGRTDLDLSDAALASQFQLDDEKVLSGVSIHSRVELVGRFNHTALWSVTTKIPLHDRAGRIIGTAGVTKPLRHQAASVPQESPLSAAVRYISQRYGEPITTLDLARACGMSQRAFQRQFAATYHMPPHDYLRNMRIRLSCSGLVFSNRSIAEVASEFWFSDQSHYTREFRRIMAETPRAYRLRHGRRLG